MYGLDDTSIDTVFDILRDEHRRYVLYRLEEERHTNLDELAQQVAAWLHDEPISELTREQVGRTEAALHHVHLPKLADSNLIEFDPRSGDVVRVVEVRELRDTLDAVKRLEERLAEPPGRSLPHA